MSATNNVKTDLKSEINKIKTDRILAAATEMFARQGYNNSTMDEIARSLGVTKPFVYYRYRDKADILAAICIKGSELTNEVIKNLVEGAESPTARLEAFCRQFAKVVIDYAAYIVVYKSEFASLRPDDRRAIMQIRISTDNLLVELLTKGQQAGEFDLPDPAITATSLTGMLSFIVDWYRPGRGPTEDQVIDTVTKLGLRMAGAKSRRRGG